MTALNWTWHTLLDWHLPVLFAFGPLLILEVLHVAERRRERRRRQWAAERAVLRSLRTMHPGPRSIP